MSAPATYVQVSCQKSVDSSHYASKTDVQDECRAEVVAPAHAFDLPRAFCVRPATNTTFKQTDLYSPSLQGYQVSELPDLSCPILKTGICSPKMLIWSILLPVPPLNPPPSAWPNHSDLFTDKGVTLREGWQYVARQNERIKWVIPDRFSYTHVNE